MSGSSTSQRCLWLTLLALLWAGLFGLPSALPAVYLLSAADTVHAAWRERDLGADGVKVRVALLGLLLAGQLPALDGLLWLLAATATLAFAANLITSSTTAPARHQSRPA